MDRGWIKLHRKLQEHWLYKEKRTFSRYEAWIDLLMMANHKANKIMIDGELQEVKRGDIVSSIRRLCNNWKWSNTKVINFLNLLQDEKMIVVKSDTKKTLITIVNYDTYHEVETEKTTQKHHESDTETKQKHTNKNVKNVKNVKNKDIRHRFETCDMNLAKLLFEKILENNPNHKKPNLDAWANDMRLIRERDKRTVEQIEYLIKWSQAHSFWHTNILSPAKLRKQFDKLIMQVKQEKSSKVTTITEARRDKYNYDLGF